MTKYLAYCGRLVAVGLVCTTWLPWAAAGQPFDVKVVGSDPNLRVASVFSQIIPAVDVQTRLLYRRQVSDTRITVETSCPGQSFTLLVEAVEPSAGIAAPPVQLQDGMAAADFIVSIPPDRASGGGDDRRGEDGLGSQRAPTFDAVTGSVEHASLRYSATATVEQGNSEDNGADVHVVTYTIIEQ